MPSRLQRYKNDGFLLASSYFCNVYRVYRGDCPPDILIAVFATTIKKIFRIAWRFGFFFLSLQRLKPVHVWTRAGHDIDGILRPTKPFVGQAEGKGVYKRYHSVHSNFATLKHFTGGNRNGKRLR